MDEEIKEARVQDELVIDGDVEKIETTQVEAELMAPENTGENTTSRQEHEQGPAADQPGHSEARSGEEFMGLFEDGQAEELRSRWLDIQSRFVDDPRVSVENADQLVDQVIASITESFARQRGSLETRWNGGDEVSTEDLRLTMKRYRSFFERLLELEA
jgi:hypothetical protein